MPDTTEQFYMVLTYDDGETNRLNIDTWEQQEVISTVRSWLAGETGGDVAELHLVRK